MFDATSQVSRSQLSDSRSALDDISSGFGASSRALPDLIAEACLHAGSRFVHDVLTLTCCCAGGDAPAARTEAEEIDDQIERLKALRLSCAMSTSNGGAVCSNAMP
jgi:hypothetical protein